MNRARNHSKSAGRRQARKNNILKACVTEEEKDSIEARARAAGISVSRFLVQCAMCEPIPRRSRVRDAIIRQNQILLGLARHVDELGARLDRQGSIEAVAMAAQFQVVADVFRAAGITGRTAGHKPATSAEA